MARQLFISSRNPGKGNFHYYNLPKGMLQLSFWQQTDTEYELKYEVKMLPDPDHRYYLQYNSRGNSHDKVKISFSKDGYLAGLESSVEDKSLEVIENIIDTVKQVVAPGTRGLTEPVELFQITIDPFDQAAIDGVIKTIKDLVPDFKLSFKALGKGNENEKAQSQGGDMPGLYCKPMQLCELQYELDGTIKQSIISLPHPEVTHLISVPYAPLVKSTLNITFDELGYPTSIDMDQPSWMVELSTFPARFLKGLIDIPAQLVRLRVNYDNSTAEAGEELLAAKEKIKALEQKKKDALLADAEGEDQNNG